jgi:hypothetical protein
MMSELSHPPLRKGKPLPFKLKFGMMINKNAMDLTKKTEMDFVG